MSIIYQEDNLFIILIKFRYAPALRPLRPLCRIVRYKPPSTLSTVSRLKSICTKENLSADTKSLNLLAEQSQGDIRNCLNTLQFMKNNSLDISQSLKAIETISSKDKTRSIQSVISSIFKLKNGKSSNVNECVQDIQQNGEYDKLLQNCFEIYLDSRVNDSRWDRYLIAINACVDSDTRFNNSLIEDTYLPYHLAKFHNIFANINNSHLVNSVNTSSDYERYVERSSNLEIARGFMSNIPLSLYRSYDLTGIITEFIPMIIKILGINLKLVRFT